LLSRSAGRCIAPIHHASYAAPDFALIHQELKRKGVTLMLLWLETPPIGAV